MGKSGFAGTLVVLFLLGGCSGYEPLPKQKLDESFALSGVNWTTGDTTIIMLKSYRHGDKLAICAAYSGSIHDDPDAKLTRQYFDRTSIIIGDETVGNMSFANKVLETNLVIEKLFDRYVIVEAGEPANCVRTKFTWKEDYSRIAVELEGPGWVWDKF